MRKHLYAGVRPLCLYWLNNSIGSFSVYIAFIMYCHSIRGQHTPTPTTCRTRVSSHTERSLRLKRPQLQDNPPSLAVLHGGSCSLSYPPSVVEVGRCSSSPSSLVSDIYILCTRMCCCCLLLLTLRRAIRLRKVQTGFDSSVIIQMHVCKPLTTLTPSPLPLQTLPTDHFQDSISQKISYIERMFLGVPAKWL